MVALAEKFIREANSSKTRTSQNRYGARNPSPTVFLQPKNRGPATKNRILSTKYLDQELSWYYYGYRYYSPELGRFVSTGFRWEGVWPVFPEYVARYAFRKNQPIRVRNHSPSLIISNFRPRFTDDDGTPLGEVECDLSADPDAPIVPDIHNNGCSRTCTEEHEAVHIVHISDCCRRARQAYGASSETMQSVIRAEWILYQNSLSAWSECRAYRVGNACAVRMLGEKKCGCASEEYEKKSREEKACCSDLWNYQQGAEENETHYCDEEGGAEADETECPAVFGSPSP
jgi:RHS repeat-associated protein